MFNIGAGELVVILGLALIVLGPQRLPEAIRSVGRVVGELRRISSGFQDELRNALDDSEVERDLDRLRSSSERDALPASDTSDATETTETTAVEEPSDVVVADEDNGHDVDDDGKDPEIDDEAEEPLVGDGIVDVTVDYAVEQGLGPEDNGATPPEVSDDDERAVS